MSHAKCEKEIFKIFVYSGLVAAAMAAATTSDDRE